MDKKDLEKLSKLREDAYNTIEKYNLLSEELGFGERLGLASAEINLDEVNSFKKNHKNDENLIQEFDAAENKINFVLDYKLNEHGQLPYGSIESPGTEGYWFPSSIC